MILFMVIVIMMIRKKIIVIVIVVVGRTLKRRTIRTSCFRCGRGGTIRGHRCIGGVVVFLVLITITVVAVADTVITPTYKTTFDSITNTFHFHRADQTSSGSGYTQSICIRRNNGICISSSNSSIMMGTIG